jgi:putative FmdB family regulatory protein
VPKYEYDCARCGPFSDYRPVADYELPVMCPDCGTLAPRAGLSIPAMSVGGAGRMRAEAVESGGAAASRHAAGCRCCSSKTFKVAREDWKRKLL